MPEPQFVRVRDRETGDEYDVLETSVRDEDHEVLDGYPASQYPREAKPRVDKAGRPAPKSSPATDAKKES